MGFKLVPVSPLAKSFQGPHGNELAVYDVTKLGRRVVDRSDGYQYPPTWGQISGDHCRLLATTEGWVVEDSSTNGTFVNGVRIPRGSRAAIHDGDHLRLSTPPGDVLEYIFCKGTVEVGGEEAAGKRKQVPVTEETTAKRLRSTSPVSTTAQPVPPFTPVPSLPITPLVGEPHQESHLLRLHSQLEKTNQELRRKLDQSRRELQEAQENVRKQEARHQNAQQEVEKRIEEAEKRARDKATTQVDAVTAELHASRLRVTEIEVRLRDLEAALKNEQESRAEASQQLTSTQHQLEVLQQCKETLESDVAALRAANKKLEEQCGTLRGEVEEQGRNLRDTARSRQTAVEELQRLKDQMVAEVQAAIAARKLADQAQAEVNIAREEVEVERRQRQETEKQLQQAEGHYEHLRKVMEGAEEKLQCQSDKLMVQKAQMKSLKALHSRTNMLQQQLRDNLGAMMEHLEMMTDTYETLTQSTLAGDEELGTQPLTAPQGGPSTARMDREGDYQEAPTPELTRSGASNQGESHAQQRQVVHANGLETSPMATAMTIPTAGVHSPDGDNTLPMVPSPTMPLHQHGIRITGLGCALEWWEGRATSSPASTLAPALDHQMHMVHQGSYPIEPTLRLSGDVMMTSSALEPTLKLSALSGTEIILPTMPQGQSTPSFTMTLEELPGQPPDGITTQRISQLEEQSPTNDARYPRVSRHCGADPKPSGRGPHMYEGLYDYVSMKMDRSPGDDAPTGPIAESPEAGSDVAKSPQENAVDEDMREGEGTPGLRGDSDGDSTRGQEEEEDILDPSGPRILTEVDNNLRRAGSHSPNVGVFGGHDPGQSQQLKGSQAGAHAPMTLLGSAADGEED